MPKRKNRKAPKPNAPAAMPDEHAETWTPRPDRGRDRPTRERKDRGDWIWINSKEAGVKAAKDVAAHPIDYLEHAGVITNTQGSAGRDYESLYRVCLEVEQARDCLTLWMPKGHASDDGPVEQKKRYRNLCREIGIVRESILRQVCVHERHPRGGDQIGALREALNEAERFFAKRR